MFLNSDLVIRQRFCCFLFITSCLIIIAIKMRLRHHRDGNSVGHGSCAYPSDSNDTCIFVSNAGRRQGECHQRRVHPGKSIYVIINLIKLI